MAEKTGIGRNHTRERILSAAAPLFSQFGFHAVSTRAVAAAASVNEVTIYRHFPHKRDLWTNVLQSELQRIALRSDLLAEIADATDSWAAVDRILDLIATTLTDNPLVVGLLHHTVLDLHNDLDPILRRYARQPIEVMALYLEPWIRKGDIRSTDAKSIVLILIAIVLGERSLRRVFTPEVGSKGIFETFIEMCRLGHSRETGPSNPASIVNAL